MADERIYATPIEEERPDTSKHASGRRPVRGDGRDLSFSRIMALRKKGMTYAEIANELGTTKQVISNYVSKASKSDTGPRKRRKHKYELTEAETKALAAKYSNSKITSQATREGNSGKSAAAVGHVMRCIQLSNSINLDNINSLYAVLECYVQDCYENDFPITVATMALSLGVKPDTIKNWRKGNGRGKDPEYKRFAEAVFFIVQAGIETCMATGLINPVVGIWWEKAHFGMLEPQKAETEAKSPLGERKSAKEIVDEYKDIELPD